MFSGELAPWHWIIIAILLVVLFGSKKLPGAARSIGKSMRILKSEVTGMHNDDAGAPPAAASYDPPPAATSAPTAQPAQSAETTQMREEAARLREQAALLERRATDPQPLTGSVVDSVRTEPGRNL